MSLETIDVRILAVLLAPSIGFGIWLYKRFLDDARHAREVARDQDNLIRALFAEIDFNTRDMEIFRELSRSNRTIRERLLADPDLVPHITDARHTEIYRNRISDLHRVSDRILGRMVQFYGLLEKIRVQIEAVQFHSFRSISAEGRIGAIELIRSTALQAEYCGESLLQLMREDYANLHLTRLDRQEPILSDGEMSQRMKALEAALSEHRSHV